MKRRIFKLVLVTCFILTVTALFTVTASAETYGDLTYEVSNGEVTITGASTSATSVTIPSTINGCPVTSIGDAAFYNCTSLKSISIPDSVSSIGGSAFSDCTSLTSITLPFVGAEKNGTENTHFGYIFGASSSSYNSLNVPAVLKTVVITGGSSIGKSAFSGCKSLASISIPDTVKSIDDLAFSGCTSLTSIRIPDSVTSIGYRAFESCTSLMSITLPFVGNKKYGTTNTHFGYIFGASKYYDNFSSVPSALKTVVITGGSSIGSFAFYGCQNLTSVSIPDSVTSIGGFAFGYCYTLASISIPDSVTSIGARAFESCTSLASITLPFVGAEKNGTKNTHFGYIFGASSRSDNESFVPATLKTVVITGGSSIGEWAFLDCTSLESIKILESVTSIGEGAFSSCMRLKSISIPKSVTSIGEEAFWNCTSLTSISIGDSVTSIGNSAFRSCSKLNTVYYCGTAAEWNGISIGSGNTALTSATREYHKYAWTTTTEPTCTENGIETEVCEFCGEAKGQVTLPALGHRVVCALVDAIKTENDTAYPFSLSDGVYSSTNKAHSSKSTFTITALYDCTLKLEYSVSSESNYDKLIISKNGTALYTNSGVVSWTAVEISLIAGDKLTISYSKDLSESSNADTGYFKFSCDQVVIPADELEPTCKDAVICSYCNEVVKPISGHTGEWYSVVAHTCTAPGLERRVCSVCSKQENKVIPASHSWGEWYVTTPATCTAQGEKRRDCSACTNYETNTIPMLPHSGVRHSAKAPTCTDIGWDAYVTCSKCDYTTYKDIPATGHSIGDWYVKTAPTCTEEGVEERICTNGCGLAETRPISATGHSIGDWYVTTPATCTAEGVEERICTNGCGLAETRPISATEHSIGEWYVKTAPACTAEGVEERICTNNCGLAETRPIPATGHSYSDWNILVEPTSESAGFKSKVCSACGDEVFEIIYFASGDIDGDGTLTNADITLAVRALSGWNIEGNTALIDTNYDGKINNRDIIVLIRKLAGID